MFEAVYYLEAFMHLLVWGRVEVTALSSNLCFHSSPPKLIKSLLKVSLHTLG